MEGLERVEASKSATVSAMISSMSTGASRLMLRSVPLEVCRWGDLPSELGVACDSFGTVVLGRVAGGIGSARDSQPAVG